MRPDDGTPDGAGESFALRPGELAPGPRVITVQVLDEDGNERLGEARFDER